MPDAYETAALRRIDALDAITKIRLGIRLLAACARDGCPPEGKRFCGPVLAREPERCVNCWLRAHVALGCE